jgi:Tfp pilus assembly protein PilX
MHTIPSATVSRHALSGNERGMILALILLMLPVVALLGAVAIRSTTTDVEISGNYKATVRAVAAAEAGLEEARARLIGSATDATFAGDPAATPNAVWTSYLLTTNSWQTSRDPYYNAARTNYVPTTASRTNTTITANSLQTTIAYWVKLQHKREYDAEQAGHTVAVPHYYDGDGSTTPHTAAAPGSLIYYGYGNPATPTKAVQFTTAGGAAYQPVEMLTAYGNSGGSVSVLQVEVGHDPGPPLPAVIYSRANFTGHGSSMTISGLDQCGVAPAIGSVYTLAPGTTSLSGNPTLLGNPSSPQSGAMNIDIAGYINNLKDGATVVTSDQNGTNFGSASEYVTVYSNTSNPVNAGGLTIQNGTGYGLLLVQGDLVMGGGFVWNGLVLVTGNVTFNGGGSAANIRGAVLGGAFESVNGGVDLAYDSCKIKNVFKQKPLRVLSWRELD